MNPYRELVKRQQKELGELPLGYCFSDDQFMRMMEKWGLCGSDRKKVICVGPGIYIQKKDYAMYKRTRLRHRKELADAVTKDRTGDHFIYQMFYAELVAHEYGYTMRAEAALNALSLSFEDIEADPRLMRGYEKACRDILTRAS